MDKNREGGRMIDKLSTIENKILQLKQKKERIQSQQAIFFMKEANRILKEEFSIEMTLAILRESWPTASKTQKIQWSMHESSFPISKVQKKSKDHYPTSQQSGKEEVRHHNTLEIYSCDVRRARTRSLIQLGGLIEKAGLIETFHIRLGMDLQKDIDMKEPVAAFYKGLLVLNEMAKSEEVNLPLWTVQGLKELRKLQK